MRRRIILLTMAWLIAFFSIPSLTPISGTNDIKKTLKTENETIVFEEFDKKEVLTKKEKTAAKEVKQKLKDKKKSLL